MRTIALITTRPNSTVSSSLRDRLSRWLLEAGACVDQHYSFSNSFSHYDLLIVDSLDLHTLEVIRSNSKARIILADPKLESQKEIELAKKVDSCLVVSTEHKKAAELVGVRCHVYYPLPFLNEATSPETRPKEDGLTLFYHGNRIHLETLSQFGLNEMDEVAPNRGVKLEVHYNISQLGMWKPPKLKNIEIIQKQWHSKQTYQAIARSDVGLIPSLIPRGPHPAARAPKRLRNARIPFYKFGRRQDDYNLNFKITSNPGRLYTFGVFAKPAIADYVPSNSEVMRDGLEGFLCLKPKHWGMALERLLESEGLRLEMGNHLMKRVENLFDSAEEAYRVTSAVLEE